MIEKISQFLKRVWKSLKKIFVKIVSFVNNVISFFKAKYNSIIKKHPNAQAISLKIKANIESGEYNTVKISDYQVVNTFYDQDTGEIITENESTEVISYESLDYETKQRFGDRDMIIIE